MLLQGTHLFFGACRLRSIDRGLDWRPLFRLEILDKNAHVDTNRVAVTAARDCFLAKVNPPLGSKIRRLGDIKAMVESGVVRPWESDDEFALGVNACIARDVVVFKDLKKQS